MSDEEVVSVVEEFYNSCHTRADGRFCGRAAKGKRILRIPMSAKAAQSYARAHVAVARKKAGLAREAAAAKGVTTRKANQLTAKRKAAAAKGVATRKAREAARKSDDVFRREDVKGIAPKTTGRKLSAKDKDRDGDRVIDGPEVAHRRSSSPLGRMFAERDAAAKSGTTKKNKKK